MANMEPPVSMPAQPAEPASGASSHRTRMRFSLRALLIAVTMCALGVAAVVRASHVTLGVVSIATLAAFLLALSTAIYWVGPRRAFAVGFLVWGVPYVVLALWALSGESDESNCKLITSQFLHSLYPHIQHQTGTQTFYAGGGFGGGGFGGGGFGGGSPGGSAGGGVAGGTAPPPATGQDATAQTTSGSPSTGTPTPSGTPPRTWPMVPPGTPTTMPLIEPSLEDWISLGHLLWAWAFAIWGGFVTQAMWRRKSKAGGHKNH
jgi:hypothetical protein